MCSFKKVFQSPRGSWAFVHKVYIYIFFLSLSIIRINRQVMFIFCPTAFSQVFKWTVVQRQLTTSTVHIPHVSLTLLYSMHCLYVYSLDNCAVELVPRIDLPLLFLGDTAPVWKCWLVVSIQPIQYFFFASSHGLNAMTVPYISRFFMLI